MESDAARIARLYRGDCVAALMSLIALWLTIAFVFWSVWIYESNVGVHVALALGAAVLLLLNTASIFALIKHYSDDKIHLYGLDIFYVDAMRAAKRKARDVR